MEYYDLRKAGEDIDLIVTKVDYERLIQKYPANQKDIWGDLGVCIYGFEFGIPFWLLITKIYRSML
ncbi:MAG: hypothetical protein ACTSW1_12575 [Candidatus Hodarchaeales archaeon]